MPGAVSHCTATIQTVFIQPVWLHNRNIPEHKAVVYAILHSQANGCFISESVMNLIKVDGESMSLWLTTMTGQNLISTTGVDSLVVQDINLTTEIQLPRTYSRDCIPADRSLIPQKATAEKWSHLKVIADELPPYFDDAEIGLLIGENCIRAIKPRECIAGEDDDPYAVRSVLGWSIVGPTEVVPNCDNSASCNYINIGCDKRELCHFAVRTQIQSNNPAQISRMVEFKLNERSEERMAIEDKQLLTEYTEEMMDILKFLFH